MSQSATSVYLPADLRSKVMRLADAEHRSASSIIVESVRYRFARIDEATQSVGAHQMRRLDGRLDKAIRDTMLVKESLLLFVRVWLEHNPPLDEEIEDAAAASAAARFERFLDYVANAIDSGRSGAIVGAATGEADHAGVAIP